MLWHQLQGWQEYFALEPFGEESAWLRHGMLCSLIYSANASSTSPKRTPIDFMPFADDGRGRRRSGQAKQVTRAEAEASWASFVGSVKKHLKPRRDDKDEKEH